MRMFNIFIYEWKHFIRSRFKLLACVLFLLAGVYGLHNGAELYHRQIAEIEKIEDRIIEDREKLIKEHYDPEIYTIENRPWIDYSEPFWAIRFSYPYHFKQPSPAMVYSIGQSEQYGFYKRVTFWASPYDSDLAEEIANPERLQTGTLDFSFVLLFLLPLLLLILLYNLKSSETEQGFISLIQVQIPSQNLWLIGRISFYVLITSFLLITLMLYGASLTPVFSQVNHAFIELISHVLLFLLFWSVLFFFILQMSKSILGNTLLMSSVYLIFSFIIPATVHQILSIEHPANLMTDFIDVRDQEQELYNEADSVFQAKLDSLFPEIVNSVVYQMEDRRNSARNSSASALSNELNKASILPIEIENRKKNEFIESSYWFNPLTYFQNKFNLISQTHYSDYQTYRDEIQRMIDLQIKTMVLDTWNDRKIDKNAYDKYIEQLSYPKE